MLIRRMTNGDLPLGLRLSAQAGWNQTEADWRRFLWLEPEGCFVAEWAGEPVATTAAFVFGSVGWIAMVLVDEAFRHRGIATQLVERALKYLDGRGVQTVRLDATPLGQPVYQRLGFLAEYDLIRMHGTAAPTSVETSVSPLSEERLGAVCELDGSVTGTPRGRLIRRLYAECPHKAMAMFDDETAVCYAFWRAGRRARHLGPAAAVSIANGIALLTCIWARCQAGPVFIDLPVDNRAAMEWVVARGFVAQREFTRMYLGQRRGDLPRQIWASSGPEKG